MYREASSLPGLAGPSRDSPDWQGLSVFHFIMLALGCQPGNLESLTFPCLLTVAQENNLGERGNGQPWRLGCWLRARYAVDPSSDGKSGRRIRSTGSWSLGLEYLAIQTGFSQNKTKQNRNRNRNRNKQFPRVYRSLTRPQLSDKDCICHR